MFYTEKKLWTVVQGIRKAPLQSSVFILKKLKGNDVQESEQQRRNPWKLFEMPWWGGGFHLECLDDSLIDFCWAWQCEPSWDSGSEWIGKVPVSICCWTAEGVGEEEASGMTQIFWMGRRCHFLDREQQRQSGTEGLVPISRPNGNVQDKGRSTPHERGIWQKNHHQLSLCLGTDRVCRGKRGPGMAFC